MMRVVFRPSPSANRRFSSFLRTIPSLDSLRILPTSCAGSCSWKRPRWRESSRRSCSRRREGEYARRRRSLRSLPGRSLCTCKGYPSCPASPWVVCNLLGVLLRPHVVLLHQYILILNKATLSFTLASPRLPGWRDLDPVSLRNSRLLASSARSIPSGCTFWGNLRSPRLRRPNARSDHRYSIFWGQRWIWIYVPPPQREGSSKALEGVSYFRI